MKWSEHLKMFQKGFVHICSSRTRGSRKRLKENGLGEVSWNNHESKEERLERLGQKLKTGAGTQIGVPICFTEYPQLSSLAAELWTPCCPLPDWSGRRKPFVQGWTHTSCRLRRFFKTPPTVEPVDENLFPGVDTHTEPFSARSK